jgi:hypothetical protein
MRRLLSAALAAAFFVSGTLAFAATLGGLYPAFATTVQNRLSVLTGALSKDEKKQKTALTKASKALAATSNDLAKMISAASKAVAALEPAYPEDPQFQGAFDQIVNDLHAEVTQRINGLGIGIDLLPEGKKKAAAQALRAKTDAAETTFASATSRAAQLKLVAGEYASVLKAERILASPGPGLVALTRFSALVGKELVQAPGLPPQRLIRSVYDQSGTGAFTFSATSGGAEERTSVSFSVAAPGAGAKPMAVSADSWYSTSRDAPHQLVTSGTVTFTVWDPDNRRASGTLTATFADGTKLTKGVFSTIDLLVQ